MILNVKWLVIIFTILLWAIGVCFYCFWYITSILAEPGWDAYAYSTGFQFLMFMLLRFPFLLLGLFAVTYIEAVMCEGFLSKKES